MRSGERRSFSELSSVRTKSDACTDETKPLFGFEETTGLEDTATPYSKQGDAALYSPGSLLRRQTLQTHPEVRRSILQFWDTFVGTGKCSPKEVSRREFVDVAVKFCKALVPPREFQLEHARETAARDWKAEHGEDCLAIQAEAFAKSHFELVDVWCPEIGAAEYSQFLDTLFERVTADGERGRRSWKPTEDIVGDSVLAPPSPSSPDSAAIIELYKSPRRSPARSPTAAAAISPHTAAPVTPPLDPPSVVPSVPTPPSVGNPVLALQAESLMRRLAADLAGLMSTADTKLKGFSRAPPTGLPGHSAPPPPVCQPFAPASCSSVPEGSAESPPPLLPPRGGGGGAGGHMMFGKPRAVAASAISRGRPLRERERPAGGPTFNLNDRGSRGKGGVHPFGVAVGQGNFLEQIGDLGLVHDFHFLHVQNGVVQLLLLASGLGLQHPVLRAQGCYGRLEVLCLCFEGGGPFA